MFNAVKAKNDCVQWIRDWFEVNGPGCNAVIGISGGKDSSVVAALCVEALGKDRVIGVLMPNGTQSDFDVAERVCEILNITDFVIDISKAVNALKIEFTYDTAGLVISEQAKINLPPRIRMATLYMVAQTFNGRVACTDNASESYIGYSTRWGDNIGDFCPLLNLTSDEVIAVGDACGLPYELTHKTPSDGLCGKTDEDNFGFTYAALNKYILTGECEDKEVKAKIDNLHNKNLFKTQPIPSFVPMGVRGYDESIS
jgi:NAD+ synthase